MKRINKATIAMREDEISFVATDDGICHTITAELLNRLIHEPDTAETIAMLKELHEYVTEHFDELQNSDGE